MDACRSLHDMLHSCVQLHSCTVVWKRGCIPTRCRAACDAWASQVLEYCVAQYQYRLHWMSRKLWMCLIRFFGWIHLVFWMDAFSDVPLVVANQPCTTGVCPFSQWFRKMYATGYCLHGFRKRPKTWVVAICVSSTVSQRFTSPSLTRKGLDHCLWDSGDIWDIWEKKELLDLLSSQAYHQTLGNVHVFQDPAMFGWKRGCVTCRYEQ